MNKPDATDERIRQVVHAALAIEDAVTSLDVFRQADADPSECFRCMATDPELKPAGWRSGLRTFTLKEN